MHKHQPTEPRQLEYVLADIRDALGGGATPEDARWAMTRHLDEAPDHPGWFRVWSWQETERRHLNRWISTSSGWAYPADPADLADPAVIVDVSTRAGATAGSHTYRVVVTGDDVTTDPPWLTSL